MKHIFRKKDFLSLEKEADEETGQLINKVISRISPYWKVF